jgi:acetolactate synthase I/II/III large subunit
VRGYQAIPELLRSARLPVVFGMLGGTNVQWLAEGVQTGALRCVKTRHEDTAISAATGYARASGNVGVCTVTRGPGFANSVNAMRAAAQDHVPVLMIVGESPATKARTSQNIDQRALAQTVGAGFRHVSRIHDLETGFWNALERATFNGLPQVLSIADGLLDATIEFESVARRDLRPFAPPDPEAVTAAIDAFENAHYPLVLAGQGAMLTDSRLLLEEFAELVGAQVASTLNVNRFFSGHPHDLGVCGDSSPPPVVECLEQIDAVIAVGATLNSYTTRQGQLFSNAKVVHCEIDIEQPFRASQPELGLLADARQTAEALISEWKRRGNGVRAVRGTTPSLSEMQTSILKLDLGHDPRRGLDPRAVHSAFDQCLPSDRVVVTDSARALATMPTLVDAPDARSWLVSRGYGSIGLGLGAAIGAAAAQPDRPVTLFTGDGGFMMASHDLDAVAMNGFDLNIVVLNDEQYGSELVYLDRYDLPLDIARQPLPDVPTLARAFGGEGVIVRTQDELDAIELPRSGLFIVDARIDPEVNARSAY